MKLTTKNLRKLLVSRVNIQQDT